MILTPAWPGIARAGTTYPSYIRPPRDITLYPAQPTFDWIASSALRDWNSTVSAFLWVALLHGMDWQAGTPIYREWNCTLTPFLYETGTPTFTWAAASPYFDL